MKVDGWRNPAELVAGVDSSTQATKVVIVEVETGNVVATGRAPHHVAGRDGARESEPTEWWSALRAALAETGIADQITAISVGAQQHGLVVLDRGAAPLRPAILWNDTRSARDASELIDALGGARAWSEAVGSVPVPSFTVTRWAWLRRAEPHIADATAAIRLPHDYLTERLTGEPATDRGDASGTGWWSGRRERYVDDVLSLPAVAISSEMLPPVCSPGDAAGRVRDDAALELGLQAGIPVGPGTGDNMAAALGLGAAAGEPVLSLGTSGTAYAVSRRAPSDPTGTVAGFADATGAYLPLACLLNCTLAVDRVASWLGLDRDAVQPSAGVRSLPYFDGERTPNLPGAAAALFGLRHDTTPGAILLATYEAVVAGLLDALDAVLAETMPAAPADAPLTLVGGGAQGRTWIDVVSRLSGREVRISTARELVALGAAVQAAAVRSGESPAAVADRWRGDALVVPGPTGADLDLRDSYRTLRGATEAFMSGWQRGPTRPI